MRTTDIFGHNKAQKLNENFEKTFGKRLALETFTVSQLEDARNRLRTQVSQVRDGSGFNETIENEALTQAQWMLDSINAELAERFEQTAIHSTEVEQAPVEEGTSEYKTMYDDWMNSEDAPFDDMAGDYKAVHQKAREYLFSRVPRDQVDEIADILTGMHEGDDDIMTHLNKELKPFDDQQAGESQTQGNDMTSIKESAADKAGAVVVAKDMTDKVGRWIEELSGMENDTLLNLGDTIRDEMGQEQAKAYLEVVAPAIQQALAGLKMTRETLAGGMRSLTGEEQSAEVIGAEPTGEEPGMDVAAPDEMNAGEELPPEPGAEEDAFAASEPATGGLEAAGREQRESINFQNRLLSVLAG